jgi:hypothetical protein
MTKVFAAQKNSYGADFMREFNTLEELKKGILENELYSEMYDYDKSESKYNDTMYTEELFKQHSMSYMMYEIDLHDDERLDWSDYDGQSYFSIVKKEPEILSTMKRID